MIYSELYLKQNTKLPIIISFFLTLFVVVIFSRFFLGLASSSKASLKVAKRVEVVNLSPGQANVYWQTEQGESGWVMFGEAEGKETKIVLDEKDLNNNNNDKGKYKVHLVTLKELTPGTRYFFKIISNNNKIIVQPDGRSFNFTTPQSNVGNLQNINPAFGKLLQSNSISPLVNSYILLTVKGGFPLLTEIKPEGDGSWLIPLNQIYSKDSKNLLTISDKDKIIIEVITSEGEELTITTVKSKISPLPQTIVFTKDKNFSFIEEDNVLSASTNLIKSSNNEVEIIYPKEDALIPGKIPLIKGIGIPKTAIEITVNSKKTYSAIIESDGNGSWSYLLPENLEPGQHLITLKTKNKSGGSIMIQRKFTIIAQKDEGKVLGTATSEPTIIFTPTPTTYVAPTSVPTAPLSVTITQPVSGSNFVGATLFGSLSLIIIGGGILLAF